MTTTLRRILTAAAAAGVLSLAAAGPAAAEHERGSGPYSVAREGFVDDADLVPLRTGLGATLVGLALTAAAVAGPTATPQAVPASVARARRPRPGSACRSCVAGWTRGRSPSSR